MKNKTTHYQLIIDRSGSMTLFNPPHKRGLPVIPDRHLCRELQNIVKNHIFVIILSKNPVCNSDGNRCR